MTCCSVDLVVFLRSEVADTGHCFREVGLGEGEVCIRFLPTLICVLQGVGVDYMNGKAGLVYPACLHYINIF